MFIAGLTVGRTSEYLGKKIQAAEMKLVTLFILAMPIALLVFAAASMTLKSAATYQPGTHGLSEVLNYLASAANNKGLRSPTREPAHSGTRSRRASPC